MIAEALFINILSFIITEGSKAVWKKLSQKEKIIKIQTKFKIPVRPEDNFNSIYSHALIQYCADKEKPVLEFFKNKKIKDEFFRYYEEGIQQSELIKNVKDFVKSFNISDELRDSEIHPIHELVNFSNIYNEILHRAATPVQKRILHAIENRNEIEKIADKYRSKLEEQSDQLRQWFIILGYKIENDVEKIDDYIEWSMHQFIQEDLTFKSKKIFVRFTLSEPEPGDIKNFFESFSMTKAHQGWLISDRNISKSIKDIAVKDCINIVCMTVDELFELQADFSQYFNWLEAYIMKYKIDTDYNVLACKRNYFNSQTHEKLDEEIYRYEDDGINEYLDQWLEDSGQNLVVILGKFGIGKTWSAHYYAYRQMCTYIRMKRKGLKRPKLPIVVPLRTFFQFRDIEELINRSVIEKHVIHLPGFSAFEQLNRTGRLLLLFDGFDETCAELDQQKMKDFFRELCKMLVPGAKVILTCRSELFVNTIECHKFFHGDLPVFIKGINQERFKIPIVDLLENESTRIEQILSNKTNLETKEIILSNNYLKKLSQWPVMRDYISQACSGKKKDSINLSQILLHIVIMQLEKNAHQQRTFTSLAHRFFLMCEFSWDMIEKKEMHLNIREIQQKLESFFDRFSFDERVFECWQFDILRNTVLTRNEEGHFMFPNNVFVQFFSVVKSLAKLGGLPEYFINYFRMRADIDYTEMGKGYKWSDYFAPLNNHEDVRMQALKEFLPEERALVLANLGTVYAGNDVEENETFIRLFHEITGWDESVVKFHGCITGLLEEFKTGKRDIEQEQGLISFIYHFRQLNQDLKFKPESLRVNQLIKEFWKNLYEKEMVQLPEDQLPKESFRINEITFEMVEVPAGSFFMGDHKESISKIQIENPFLMTQTPVTQELYKAVMNKNLSGFQYPKGPVENVCWLDAIEFCNNLSKTVGLKPAYKIKGEKEWVKEENDYRLPKVDWLKGNNGFRLPLESEWEYACRAGSASSFYSGDSPLDAENIMWSKENSNLQTHPVMQKLPNQFGLYDMHGNVWEWTWDSYSSQADDRVIRGGSWRDPNESCRSAIRYGAKMSDWDNNIGFRVVVPKSY